MKEYEFDIDVLVEDDQGKWPTGIKIVLDENTLRQLKDALEEVDD